MTVDPQPLPSPTAVLAEPPVSESAVTPLLNAEKIDDGVDLIGDATSWPSLSESTRPSPMSSPSPQSDPTIAASQEPEISQSSQNLRHHNTNTSPHLNPNRQRSSGRSGSSRGGASRGGFVRHPRPHQQLPSPPPLLPTFYSGFEGPMGGTFFYGNGFGAYPHPIDHRFSQSSSAHKGVVHPHGDRGGHYNHANYRGPDWNVAPQGIYPRDIRFPQSGLPVGFPMPHQSLAPFAFMHAPVFPPEPFMGMPPYAGGRAPGPVPPPSLSSPSQVEIKANLLSQINYYFSNENLIKDMYLRNMMDGGGWVPVALIANFRRVRDLTQDIQLILEALEASTVVEVQGDNIRRRNDWRRWITTSLVSEEPTTELNTMTSYFKNATLEEARAADRNNTSATNASSSPREVLT